VHIPERAMVKSQTSQHGSGTVTIESFDEGVRVLALEDPARRNALSWALQADLTSAVGTLAGDPAARVLVITGRGPAFCTGADLPEVFGNAGRHVADVRDTLRKVYASFLKIRELQMPTIAAVNGAATGAGVNLVSRGVDAWTLGGAGA